MQSTLDRFILDIPRLFIKQFPYAWFPLIVLWVWPPNISLIFLAIIVIGPLLLQWQSTAWISHIHREYAPEGGKFYMDRPALPWRMAVRNIAILLVVSGIVAFVLNGQLGLSFWQYFLIIVLFSLTYRNSLFFGAQIIYIITASGIAVYFAPGHLDYRLFLTFKEISRIERTQYQKDQGWDFFVRTKDVKDGLLLTPKDPKGFSKRMWRLFIAPGDIEAFIEQLPYGYGKHK